MLLKFIAFNLETTANCRNDFLEVFDGDNAGARSLAKLCGIAKPNPIYSTGNTLTLVFKTDQGDTNSGFNVSTSLGNNSLRYIFIMFLY